MSIYHEALKTILYFVYVLPILIRSFFMDFFWLIYISVFLGLFAWVFPLFAIKKFKIGKNAPGVYMVFSSFICALLSLLMLNTYRNYLIHIEDWILLMDTTAYFQLAAVVICVLTGILNSAALFFMVKRMQNERNHS